MDLQLLDIIEDLVPKINPIIANGVVTTHIHEVESYIDRDLVAAAEQFPDGLRYDGFERCTPTEEYRELVKPRDKIYVELSRSDMYLAKYKFSYNGVAIEDRFLYLPYVLEAGIMHIRGTPYSISAVIADIAFSSTPDGLFVPLSMAKVQFMRLMHHFVIDGRSQSRHVAHSNLYRRSKKSKAVKLGKNSRCSTLVHYMLCKMGLTEMFDHYFDVQDIHVGYDDVINDITYPPEEWAICSSSEFQPASNKDKPWRRSAVRLAIRKHYLSNPAVLDALGAVYYVIDHFPERVKPEHMENPRLWQRLMGHVIFGDEYGEGELTVMVNDHLESLDGYVNFQSRRTLHQGKVDVEDIYELFSYVIVNLPELILKASTTVASMYDKRLMVVRYLLSNISFAIYKLMFRLRVQAKKKKDKLTVREILDAMRKGLHRDLITTVTSNHTEVTPVSSPGDNKFFKITSNLVLQESTDASRGGNRGGGSLEDPAKWMHASLIEVASYTAMSKSEPTGRSRINPCLQLSPRGDVLRHEQHRVLLDYAQSLFQRK